MNNTRLFLTVTILCIASCGSDNRVVPGKSGSESLTDVSHELSIETRFERHVCGVHAECSIKAVTDPTLDYGAWLASRLGVEELAELHSRGAYVEAGPDENGDWFSLGIVRYQTNNEDGRTAILQKIDQGSDGVFKDDKVILRYKVANEAEGINVVFTDSFHPKLDSFWEAL